MGTELVALTGNNELVALAEKAKGYVEASRADATRRSYRTAWKDFTGWCLENGTVSLPATPETVALYVTARAERWKSATIAKVVSAIGFAHEAAGHPSPTACPLVSSVLSGIRREKGTAPVQKAPALTADIRAMVGTLGDDPIGKRDRALLLVGFAGAFRRSELVGLDREDVEASADGLTVTLRRSKTDQEGAGRKVGIPYGSNPATCPVRALLAWLEASGISAGPLFRSVDRHGNLQAGRLTDKTVARVVKRSAEAAGMDPTRYSGHSLRSGLATSAAMAGVSLHRIADQTGHRSLEMVRRYVRTAEIFRDNAAGAVGL